jgi:hypothetical protein
MLYTYGRIEMQFQALSRLPPFDRPEMREELQSRLNAIPGVSISPDRLKLRPSFPVSALADSRALQTFFKTMDWVLEEFRTAVNADSGRHETPT